MRAITSLSLVAFGLLVGAAPVRAADIIEEPIVEIPIQTSGWYLRGDVGYVTKTKTTGSYNFWNEGVDANGHNPGPIGQGIDEVVSYDKIELRGGASYGVGAGYRFSDQFRADVTVDYFKTDVHGSSDCAYLVEKGYKISPVNSGCHYKDSSSAAIWTTMANAYVDLAHFGPITPYIGAGLGFAHVKYDDMRNEIYCGDQPDCANVAGYQGPGLPTYTGVHGGLSSWRFASSLTAGASVDITQQLKFDAGYRYTRISNGDAYGYDQRDTAANATGTQGRDNGFNIHTIRAGLRYDFF